MAFLLVLACPSHLIHKRRGLPNAPVWIHVLSAAPLSRFVIWKELRPSRLQIWPVGMMRVWDIDRRCMVWMGLDWLVFLFAW
jgi:hypothetical protein